MSGDKCANRFPTSVLGDESVVDGMDVLYELLSGRSVQDISMTIDTERATKRARLEAVC